MKREIDNLSKKDLTRAKRTAYMREWRAKNREKQKQNNWAYWVRRTQKELGRTNVTEGDVRECRNAHAREYRKNNPQIVARTKAKYYNKCLKNLEQEQRQTEENNDEEI